MEDYSIEVMEHFMNPQNVGVMGNPQGEYTYGDASCGDELTIFLKIEDEIITDIKYLIYGCGAAVATSSKLSEMAKGKSVNDAYAITEAELTDALGGLPKTKLHCSVLGVKALRGAIEDYRNKQMYICIYQCL